MRKHWPVKDPDERAHPVVNMASAASMRAKIHAEIEGVRDASDCCASLGSSRARMKRSTGLRGQLFRATSGSSGRTGGM